MSEKEHSGDEGEESSQESVASTSDSEESVESDSSEDVDGESDSKKDIGEAKDSDKEAEKGDDSGEEMEKGDDTDEEVEGEADSKEGGVAFVVNPAAGKGFCERKWATFEPKLEEKFQGECTQIVVDMIEEGWKTVVCVGGDGTINECTRGYVNAGGKEKGVSLGIIPLGTGSDYIRTIKTPVDPMEALELIADVEKHRIIEVDVGKIQYGEKESTFTNITGAGVGASVCRNNGKLKRKIFRKGLIYTLVLIGTAARYKRKHVRYQINDGEWHVCKSLNVLACNGQYQGGGMWMSPEADVSDGEFEVVVFGDIGFLGSLFKITPKLKSGRHLQHRKVEMYKGVKKLVVEPDKDNFPRERPVLFELDGEYSEEQCGAYEVTVLEKVMKLIVKSEEEKKE